MKKKNGFTLAEVLVTLGIIGVVAALAMPALNSSVQRTKVGPSLRKFMNALENSNRIMLQEEDVNDLSEKFITVSDNKTKINISDYVNAIHKQFANGSITETKAAGADGKGEVKKGNVPTGTIVYTLGTGEEFYFTTPTNAINAQGATNFKGVFLKAVYDMNGFGVKPDINGKDTFYFYVDNNGAVFPVGGKIAGIAYGTSYDTVTSDNCFKSTEPCKQEYASGVIEKSNWKVPYKY